MSKYMKLNKEPEHNEPKLFMVTLRAGDANKGYALYNSYAVAYNLQQAVDKVISRLRDQDQEIYADGIERGGWRHHQSLAITGGEIEDRFNNCSQDMQKLKEEKKQEEKNRLMELIIKHKDPTLLRRHIELFTSAERKYLESKIQ